MKTDTTQSRHSGLLWRSIFFPLAFVYMELLFHIAIYGSAGSSILHPLTFALACGLTLSALTSFWHRYANAAIAYLLWSIFTIYYIAQFVYYKIFRTFLSLVSIGGAQDAMNFRTVLFSALRSNWYIIVLFLLPLICLIIMNRFWFHLADAASGRSLVCSGQCWCSWVSPQLHGYLPSVFWQCTGPRPTLHMRCSTDAMYLNCP